MSSGGRARDGEESPNAVTAGERVVVCFAAQWCEPAQTVARALTAAAGSDVACRTVDVEERPVLAGRYGVDILPTVVRFEDGVAVERLTGVPDDEALRRIAEG
jgi:thioredoxin 1